MIAALERQRDALRHELLTRGLPGRHTEWKNVPYVGRIPAGWTVGRIRDLADVNARAWSPAERGPIKYLELASVTSPGVLCGPRVLRAVDAPSRARRHVSSGDILVSTVRPNLRGFAHVSVAPYNLVASTGFAVLSPRSQADAGFLYQHVMSNRFARRLERAATGQAYPAVRPDDVIGYPIALPSASERAAIGTALNAADETIEQTRAAADAVDRVRAAVADALLTGRVRVRFPGLPPHAGPEQPQR